MEDDALETLIKAWAIPALAGSMQILRFLANRALVTPEQVEEFASSLTAHLQTDAEDPRKPGFDELAANLEGIFSPALARIRELARLRCDGYRDEDSP